MGLPTDLKIFNPELFLSKGNKGTTNGAESDGKSIQELPHLGIHPMPIPETLTLLMKPRCSCRYEPVDCVLMLTLRNLHVLGVERFGSPDWSFR